MFYSSEPKVIENFACDNTNSDTCPAGQQRTCIPSSTGGQPKCSCFPCPTTGLR